MTSPQFEVLLAKIYTDAKFRRRFLEDPAQLASESGLSTYEISQLIGIDRVGLELAAKTFAYKRSRSGNKLSHFISQIQVALSKLCSKF